jgi:hypothetical protein
MNSIGRILALLATGFVLTSISAAIAARAMKQRIVRVDAPDANEVTLAAIFEPINFRSTATAFRGGTLDLWYGGGVVDLRDAFLDPGGARLEVRAVFGGAQIVVPDTWRVTTNVVGLGGIGDARSKVERPVTAPLLVIDGVAVMGGVGITSELSEQQATAVADAVARRDRATGRAIMETEPAPVP